MSNERYNSFLATADLAKVSGYYQSPAASGFNHNPDTQVLLAAVEFVLGGLYFDGDPPVDVFLWGNLDPTNFAGWGIRIRRDATNGHLLEAVYGDGAALNKASFLLGTLLATPPNRRDNGVAERLILAELILAGTTLSLAINGQVVAQDTAGDPYVASTLKATLGALPDGSQTCIENSVRINSAGVDFPAGLSAGFLAGSTFVLARETRELGFVCNQVGLQRDWAHKYLASSAAFAGTAPTADADGVQTANTEAPSSLPDSGNNAATAQVGVTAIALQKKGDGVQVIQEANVDWYAGGNPLALTVTPIG